MQAISNQIMLITYPDSLGGNLKTLRDVLNDEFAGAVHGVHILPFFPSSGDRGFAPVSYDQVDESFGDWDDIEALSRRYYLMCDMMINHISRMSREFQDFLHNGDASPYANMFLNYDAFWGSDPPPEEEAMLYRRSDKPLFVEIPLPDGSIRKLWCSFSTEQIDLDTDHPVTRGYLMRTLRDLNEHGISLVRMDAYGYITKVRGTNCFFVEPKIWGLISECEELLKSQQMTLLPEVHDRYETALKIAKQGYWTYDFVLPLLMLHTLLTGSGAAMKQWFSICPRKQFTVLDTHDGIGVYDAAGIVSDTQAAAVISKVEDNLSYAYKPLNIDRKKYFKSYQLYGTYYSILKRDDQAYLLARALQFFAPGIPQVYYVGMLAGENQLNFPESSPRDINRKNYSMEEIKAECARPVVRRLLSLMRLRNSHPAFQGDIVVEDTPDHLLKIKRIHGCAQAILTVNLRTYDFSIDLVDDGKSRAYKFPDRTSMAGKEVDSK